jgi:hypothetical protein
VVQIPRIWMSSGECQIKHLGPHPIFGGGEHGGTGLVGKVEFREDRHWRSPSLQYAPTVMQTIKKSI